MTSPEELKKLIEVADRATQLEWEPYVDTNYYESGDELRAACSHYYKPDRYEGAPIRFPVSDQADADAAFISAANPHKVRAICQELGELQEIVEPLKNEVTYLGQFHPTFGSRKYDTIENIVQALCSLEASELKHSQPQEWAAWILENKDRIIEGEIT